MGFVCAHTLVRAGRVPPGQCGAQLWAPSLPPGAQPSRRELGQLSFLLQAGSPAGPSFLPWIPEPVWAFQHTLPLLGWPQHLSSPRAAGEGVFSCGVSSETSRRATLHTSRGHTSRENASTQNTRAAGRSVSVTFRADLPSCAMRAAPCGRGLRRATGRGQKQ